MNEEKQPFELQSLPGVRRDGAAFDNPHFTDADWVRWQRKRPRKMGGYRSIYQLVSGPVRAVHVDGRAGYVRAHLFSDQAVEQLTFDNNGIGSGLVDRTPAGFSVNTLYTWQADSVFQASGGGTPQLLCTATPDLLAIDSDDLGTLYQGNITAGAALTAVADGSGNIQVSGGCCVLQPFLFVYGSNGLIRNSNANDFSVATGWSGNRANTANVAGTKIVKGLPMRGGGGNSPSGLFWALDALLRVSWVGGTELWGYDTVSAHMTILAKNAPIEYDGMFFWIGIDRFYVYNGVVQELPNDMNLNWFFDNLNYPYRNKVWALKVPRFGEIWWFFPFGTSTECNAAIIYNVREKTWYDTRLVRSAGFSARTFPRPVMAGDDSTATTRLNYTVGAGTFTAGDIVTGGTTNATGQVVRADATFLNLTNVVGLFENAETITAPGGISGTLTTAPRAQQLDVVWQHEYGVDKVIGQNVFAISAHYETRNFGLTDGGPTQDGSQGTNVQTRIERFEPDYVLTGSLALSIHGKAFPNSDDLVSSTFTFDSSTEYVPLTEQRRSMSLRIESNEVGGDFQEGKCLIMISPGDERG